MSTRTLAERCRAIQLLALDVDGCLTDGGVIYSMDESGEDSQEIKRFHVRDGSALVMWNQVGLTSAILTGRSSAVVGRRGKELGIAYVAQGLRDKLAKLDEILQEHGWTREQVAYVGDDVPDLSILRECGLAIGVADACPEVKQIAHYVTLAPGGQGAVREVIERILRCQGRWPDSF